MIEIYGSNDRLKCQVEAGSSSQLDKALQSDNVLSLSFTHYAFLELDVNDWCEFAGERYWLQEKYLPKQKNEHEWEYNVKLYGIESLIKRLLVLQNSDGENEAVFTLTAPASEHVRLIVQSMNDGMDHTTNWKVGDVVATENLTIDYDGTYCDEGLRLVAEAAGTEWWIEGETVNLCRCEQGTELLLRYGESLLSLDRDEADGVKFYTRLFPIGSSRNIDRSKYGSTRLQLPGGAKYVDIPDFVERYGVFHHYEQEAFSGIYPRRVGVISSVRWEEVKDPDGNPFTIWYFKDNGLTFDPNDYEIAGLVKHVSFQSGELEGRDFEVNYNSSTREFEIITTWPYDDDMQLPDAHGGHLVPAPGNTYILWNIRMPDEYYDLAEKEYQSAVEAFNREHLLDKSVYKAPTNPKWVERSGAQLYIGRRVRLESQKYFPKLGYRSSRITRLTRKVSDPYQIDLEISDAVSTGTMTKIEDSIHDVKMYVRESSSVLPDIIRSWDETKPTDNNIYSARRTHKEFLSKNTADTAQKLITFLEGIALGKDGKYYLNGDGVAQLAKLMLGTFVKGSTGAGIYADAQGNWHIEGDYIDVRKKITAEEVEIMKSSHIRGKVINSPGSFTVSKVEKIAGGWRCYFTQKDGDGRMVSNTMGMDDYAYCETFNLVDKDGKLSNHYWHRRVFGLGIDYVDVCDNTDADDYASGSDEPQVGDEVSTLGNKTNPARQHAIIQSAAGTGSPYYQMYVGIDSFSLPKPKIQMSPTEGSWWMVTDENGNELTMEEYLSSLRSQLQAVQEQNDKQIVIWFGDALPALDNDPAKDWIDNATRQEHLHDIYYNKGYASTGGGRAYSFERTAGGTGYEWREITDADVLTSLEAANRAQDTADGKRRVFVAQPTREQEYDIGDLWVNATYKDGTVDYSNDVLRAIVVKKRGRDFSITDWKPVQQYTTKPLSVMEQLAGKTVQAIAGNEGTLERLLTAVASGQEGSLLTMQGRLNSVISSLTGTTDLLHTAVWDDEGNLAGFRNVGLLRSVAGEDGSLTLFSDWYDAEGKRRKSAGIKLTASQDDSSLLFDADHINFLGKTVINNKFTVDANGNVTMDGFTATNANITGKVTANKGYIGPFSIGGEGLYAGDYSKWWSDEEANFVYLDSSSFLLEQQVGYFKAGDVAHLMVGFGRGSDPTSKGDEDAYCASAMYIYRRMNSSTNYYRAAARIISDNVVGRDIALELQGGLRVRGGIIEHGHFMEYAKNGDTNVLDFSFGTTFLLKNSSDGSVMFFYPSLSEIRRQLEITEESESFCVPFTLIVANDSGKIYFCSQCKASTPASAQEGGKILGNGNIVNEQILGAYEYSRDNRENSDSRVTMVSGSVMRFATCFTPTSGYYCILLSNF